MNLYNNGFQEDEFTEEEISLANGFCDACDRGVIRSYDEDQYDVIISHLMFSQKADYLKKAIEQARKEFPEDPDFAVWQARYLIWNNQLLFPLGHILVNLFQCIRIKTLQKSRQYPLFFFKGLIFRVIFSISGN